MKSYLLVYQKKRNSMCDWRHKFGTFLLFSPWLSDPKRLFSREINLFSFSISNNFHSGNYCLCGFSSKFWMWKYILLRATKKLHSIEWTLSSCCSCMSSFVMYCCHPLSSFSFLGFVFTYIFHLPSITYFTLCIIGSFYFLVLSSYQFSDSWAFVQQLTVISEYFMCVLRNKINFIKI